MPDIFLETYKNKKTDDVYGFADTEVREKIPEGASSLNPLATQDEIEDIWENNARTGVHQLFDINAPVTAVNNALYEKTTTGYRVYNTTAKSYSQIRIPLVLPKNTDIRLTGHISATSGAGNFSIDYSDNGSDWTTLPLTGTGGATTGELDYDVTGNTGNHNYYRLDVYCTTGTNTTGDITASNILITDKNDTSNAVTDYAETNLQLTQNKVSYEFNAKTGVHNLLPVLFSKVKDSNAGGTWADNVYSFRGIDYTLTVVNGYVTEIDVNGTASQESSLALYSRSNNPFVVKKGSYIFNGCPQGGSDNDYKLMFTQTVSGSAVTNNDYGDGVAVNVANDNNSGVTVVIAEGKNVDHIKFKPMLRYAEDTDSTFAPSAKTNLELTNIAPTCDLICTAGNYKAVNDEIALSADVSNYNQLAVVCCRNNSNDGLQTFPIIVSFMENNSYHLFRFRYNTDAKYIQVQYKSEGNKFVVTATDLDASEYGIRRIYGIR